MEKTSPTSQSLGLSLTAHTLLWVLTSEWNTSGEGPVIGWHPVTRVLCRLGLLSLPLQNSVSSVGSECCRTEIPTRTHRCSHNMSEWVCTAGEFWQLLQRRSRRGNVIPKTFWKNFCGLALNSYLRSWALGASWALLIPPFSPDTGCGSGKSGGDVTGRWSKAFSIEPSSMRSCVFDLWCHVYARLVL